MKATFTKTVSKVTSTKMIPITKVWVETVSDEAQALRLSCMYRCQIVKIEK